MKLKLSLILFLLLFCSQVQADTLHVEALIIDGHLLSDNTTSYAACHDASSATSMTTTAWNQRIGQAYASTHWYIYRNYIYFVTSDLPDICTIDSAKYYIYFSNDLVETEYDVCIVEVFADTTLALSHYAEPESIGAVIGGSWNTANYSIAAWYSIDLDSLNWINKTGTTKLGIRSSRDINEQPPGTGPEDDIEFIDFRSANYPDYEPYLKIWYSFAPVAVAKSGIIQDEDNRGLIEGGIAR